MRQLLFATALALTPTLAAASGDCPSPLSCEERVAAALSPLLNPTASAEAVQEAIRRARQLRESCRESEELRVA